MMLRPFGATLSCPKCNHFATGFLREYSIGLDPTTLVKADKHLAQEHIKVTCPSCGFYWREHTADYNRPEMEISESPPLELIQAAEEAANVIASLATRVKWYRVGVERSEVDHWRKLADDIRKLVSVP